MNTPHDRPAPAERTARADRGDEASEVIALPEVGEQLLAEARSARSGRAARGLIALPGLRVTLLALAEGRELAEHRAPGAATLVCLAGQATLSTADRAWTLGPDELLSIPDERHRLTAETDALVLLTVRLD
ncbi:MAG TPA: cupin domain-containing protein [Streptomyces sp.]|nr:cupin domain-containing protein [Streptomyces sp.]